MTACLLQSLNALDVQEVVDHYELAYLVHTRMVVGERPVYHDTVVSARSSGVRCRVAADASSAKLWRSHPPSEPRR